MVVVYNRRFWSSTRSTIIIWFASFVSSTATSDGDAPQCTTSGPVPATGLAKVARLREAIVVEVAKFGVCGLTSWTF